MKKLNCAIIGGGISGLSAAYFLEKECRQQGITPNISLYERAPALGGKIQTRKHEGCLIEKGPDTLLAFKPDGMALVRELGLSDQLISPGRDGFSILNRGKLYDVPPGFLKGGKQAAGGLLKMNLLSATGKVDTVLRAISQSCEAKGDESVAAYTRRRFGRQLSERVLDPLLAGIHSGNGDRLSMSALHARLMTKNKPAPLKRKSAATNSSPPSPFLSLKGGLSLIPERIMDRLEHTSFYLNCSVSGVSEISDRTTRIHLANGDSKDVDCLIFATPAHVTARLVSHSHPDLGAVLNEIPYASTAVASFLFPESSVGYQLSGSGYLVPRKEQQILAGCTWISEKWEGRAPKGLALFRVFIGNADNGAELVARPGLLEAAERELRTTLRMSDPALWSDIKLWKKAIPQYEIGHLDRVAKIRDLLKGLPNIKVIGAAFDGSGVPDCIRQGRVAAEELLRFESPSLREDTPSAQFSKASEPVGVGEANSR
jgi:oxygen-dependent protoporphyrinogen oxidase